MDQNITDIVKELFAPPGRLLGSSKGRYLFQNPKHLVYFNANLYTEDGKFWYGDIDVTLEFDKLVELSRRAHKTIYLLAEMDGRFENESQLLLDRAALVIDNCTYKIKDSLQKYVELVDGKIQMKPAEYTVSEHRETYDASNYKFVATCPNMRKFVSRDSASTPYDKFYMWIAGQLGGLPAGHIIDITRVCVSEEIGNNLKELVRNWIRKYYTDDEYDVQKETNNLSFDLGPHEFTHHEDWMEENGIYLRGELFKKRGE